MLSGQTITVDVGGDADVAGHTTLRNAIAAANAAPGDDTIIFAPNVTGTITLTQGELAITDGVSIAGPGLGSLTISGNDASRIFSISANTNFAVSISGLTLLDGNCATSTFQSGLGGAIYSSETMTLSNVAFASNSAQYGGAVFSTGQLTSSQSNYTNNTATIYGGAVYNSGVMSSTNDTYSGNSSASGGAIENQSTLTVTGTSFTGNTATIQGGAVDNESSMVSLANLYSGNTAMNNNAGGAGGAIYNNGVLSSTNDTITGNTAFTGAGIYSYRSTLTTTNDTIVTNVGRGLVIQQGTWNTRNSIIAGNLFAVGISTPAEIANNSGTINAYSNIVGDTGTSSGITDGVNGNRVGVALNAIFVTDNNGQPILANVGGPTATIALKALGAATSNGSGLAVLAASITSSNSPTTLTVDSTTTLAVGDLVRIDQELVLVTSIVDATHLVVQRGQGTAVAAHVIGASLLLAVDQTGATRWNQDRGAMANINHAPAGASKSVSIFENKPYTLKTADFGFSDPSDAPANTLLAVLITAVPDSGTLSVNGVLISAGQSVSATDIAAGKLIYTPGIDDVGGPATLCQFRVQDNGGTANGGIDLDPVARTISVTVAHINQAPVGTSGTVLSPEKTAYVVKTVDFGFSDPHDHPANAFLAVKITTLPTLGTLTLNGTPVTAGQLIAVTEIAQGKLIFTPNVTLAPGVYFLCKFQVQDDGGTVNGGASLDAIPRVLNIQLVHLNRAPVGTTGTVSGFENRAYALKTADFGFTDPNDTPANSLLAVKFTTLPTLGTLKNNGVAVTAGQVVSASDIAAGKLIFTPNANLVGGPYFLAKFQVQDNGGTLLGGVDLDPTAKVLYIRLANVNHAPQGTSGTVTTMQSIPYQFKVSDFGFSDPQDNPANTLLAVRITTLPTLGTLTNNGQLVAAGQSISVSDIINGKMYFTPKSTLAVGVYFLCKFQVQDNGGTANGGVDLDPTPKTLYCNLTRQG